jgi:hypothetical protein
MKPLLHHSPAPLPNVTSTTLKQPALLKQQSLLAKSIPEFSPAKKSVNLLKQPGNFPNKNKNKNFPIPKSNTQLLKLLPNSTK